MDGAAGRGVTIRQPSMLELQVKMRVVYLDGTEVEMVVGPRAQVEVERRYECLYTDIYDQAAGTARVEKFYFSAWAALHYAGHATATQEFEDWLNTVVDVAPVGDVAPTPTKRARRPAKSSA